MKLTVKQVDVTVEGESFEIRDAIPAILAAQAAEVMQDAPRGLGVADVAPLALEAASSTDASTVPVVVEGVGVSGVQSVEAEWTPHAGPVSPLPTAAFDSWQAIPEDRRLFGTGAFKCHVLRDTQDPFSTYCGHDVGMPKRPGFIPANAAPCGNCIRRIEEAARP